MEAALKIGAYLKSSDLSLYRRLIEVDDDEY